MNNSTQENRIPQKNRIPQENRIPAYPGLLAFTAGILWPLALQLLSGDLIRILFANLLSRRTGITDPTQLNLLFIQKGYVLFSALVLSLCMIPIYQILLLKDALRGLNSGVLLLSLPRCDTEDQKALTLSRIVLILLFSVSCALGLNQLVNLLPFSFLHSSQRVMFQGSMVLRIAASGLCVPICEELLFRGVIFRRIRPFCGKWPTVLITALLFGIYHMNLTQFIYATLLGILIALLTESFGTLWPCILFHMTANIFVILAQNVAFLGQSPWVALTCLIGLSGIPIFALLLTMSLKTAK